MLMLIIYVTKVTKTKNISKYLVGCLDDVIRPLLMLPKMSEYVKNFKDKNVDKVKNKNSKLMSFCIDKV